MIFYILSGVIIMKSKIRKRLQIMSLLLAAFLTAGLLPGGIVPQTAFADGAPVGDVIFNQPSHWTPGTTVENIQWSTSAIYHNYDIAYTEEESAKYNGVATDAHLVMRDNTIAIYGYQNYPHMDYVFSDVYKLDDLAFTLTPSNMNFHSFSETGFLFNGKMTMRGGVQYYTGYAITLTCENPAGMLENTGTAANTATLRIYFIDNEEWNTLDFQPGNAATTRTLVATVKSGIRTLDKTAYRVSIELDFDTKAFKVYIDGVLRADVPERMIENGSGHGFGFYMGSYAHNCGILSRVNYEYVMASVEPLPDPTHAKVNFLINGTTTPIRAAETNEGLPGNKYRIEPPRTIIDKGIKYVLINSDREGATSGITLVFRPDAADNVTNLYYIETRLPELEGAPPPEKEAWVNGSDHQSAEDPGATDVRAGDEIEYAITVYSPPPPPPAMLAIGNSGGPSTTAWWTAPAATHSISKDKIQYVLFIDLDLSEFEDLTEGVWDGVVIPTGEYWFASADGTNNVIAWVLKDADCETGMYRLYVGGVGGVHLSDGKNQFHGFRGLESIDFENLYTDYVTDMSYMFSDCANLMAIDWHCFNTSEVIDMSHMFDNCYLKLTSLDLRGFNTEKVTDMRFMFENCSLLKTVDLSSFDTSKVEMFNCMFDCCESLESLDLSSFDTSAAINMESMFYGCESLTTLDLSNFNTSGVISVSGMFQDCHSLAYLDLRSFNTRNVVSAYSMFSDCKSLISTKEEPFQINHFDVSNIIQFQGMFSGCYSLEFIDLCRWEIGAAEGFASDGLIREMFEDCEKLVEIHLESAVLENGAQSFYGMFTNHYFDVEIFVRESGDKEWIIANADGVEPLTYLGLTDSYAVIAPEDGDPRWHNDCEAVTLDWEDNLADWRLGYKEPEPPVRFYEGYVTITDAIPTGLAIDEDSVTGGVVEGAFAGDETDIVWKLAGQTVTWQIPADMLPVTVSVKALVTGVPGGVYANEAKVEYNGETQDTNTVTHTFISDYFLVREEYYLYNGAVTDIKIAEDYEAKGTGGSYAARGLAPPQKEMYILVGYAINDGAYAPGSPPAVAGSATIRFYYKTVTVTVHFANEDGASIKSSFTETVVPGKDYFISNKHFDSVGSLTYYDYAAGIPAPGPPTGGSPVYPAVPALENVTVDRDITLYFTAQKSITVRFAEFSNPLHILCGDETFFFSGSFNPATASRGDGKALAGSVIVEDIDGQEYRYASKYSTGGAVANGFPGTQSGSGLLITLYFETEYTVTEMFYSDGGHGTGAMELRQSIVTTIPGGEAFTGNPPSVINNSGNRWIYKGFQMSNGEAPINPGKPAVFNITEDAVIIYIYERGGQSGGGGNGDVDDETGTTGGNTLSTNTTDDQTGETSVEESATGDGETGQEEPVLTDSDPLTPPPPHDDGNRLILQEGNYYVEYDADGVPLGEWRWDEGLRKWIFNEYPPLGNLPQTGMPGITYSLLFTLLGFSLFCAGFVLKSRYSYKYKHMKH